MTPCREAPGYRLPKGYVILRRGGKNVYAHRLAYVQARALTLEDISGRAVCHACDNPACINPEHLFLGTAADNNADMRAKGRHARGQKHGTAKLSETEVQEIRTRYAAGGVTQRQLAREYGVSFQQVSDIIRRRYWSHV